MFSQKKIFLGGTKIILVDILLVGVLTILGQISIYVVILNFKQHMFPLVSTTRKILTILYSIYYFNHKTNLYMWIALVLVFGGIFYELADELYYDVTGEKPLKVPTIMKKEDKLPVKSEWFELFFMHFVFNLSLIEIFTLLLFFVVYHSEVGEMKVK